jgi:predicted Zn-dependent protease
MMTKLARVLLSALLACVVASQCALAAKPPLIGENEIKLGKDGAAEVAKQYKLSNNAEELVHLREMGQRIAVIANKMEITALYGASKITPFEYTFDIIEDKDVNAFSLPGGRIFVNRGLLDYVQSDHELAAVLAHEVIHSAHHHMVYLLTKEQGLGNQMAIALIAVMLGGAKTSDLGNVLMGVQLMQIAKMSGYGMQAERDADHGAIHLMRETDYNPVGMLTFMERLAKKTDLFDYGIYRSHPLDADRVRAAKKVLNDLKIPINRRQTTKAAKAEVKVDKVDDIEAPGIYISGKLIYRPAPKPGKTAQQRAKETADKINKMLDTNLQMHEVRVDTGGGVVARNQAMIVVSDDDAKLMDKSPRQVAQEAGDAIKDVLWKQIVDTVH